MVSLPGLTLYIWSRRLILTSLPSLSCTPPSHSLLCGSKILDILTVTFQTEMLSLVPIPAHPCRCSVHACCSTLDVL
ncbi:hypothetical protein BGZ63DRAFT_376316 [Mariannaea sp. PMI_226]|nr:hypothetical protein BGZ63DRAFT_376316 [Mariannaea sp. PMI_226]